MNKSDDKGSVRVRFFLVSMCPEIDDTFIREFEPTIFIGYYSILLERQCNTKIC
jgi:hypothetical protein